MPSFSRLVRFLAKDDRIYYGDAILPSGVTNIAEAKQARIITGDIFGKHDVTSKIAEIRLLLAPLALEDVRTVRCLGMNYTKHAIETKQPIPKFPVLFYKPATSLAGPTDSIPVPPRAQTGGSLDYECELVIVIGKDTRDVSEEEALDHVFGYTVANDVSHRDWQLKHGAGQWSLGKGFDGWAPYGPGIVTNDIIEDAQNLTLWTKLNGDTVQHSSTRDQIFGIKKTISFLSQGTTLQPGDLILTGTPEGVGMGRTPPLWLKDGDVVEVGLEGVGSITNTVEFQSSRSKI
ncbi:hypothetical protein B0J13DRAFT_566672 [Dactylonectria estremocensis]|uniref:Fumarylacetoacetase-like C-terminal domain-containing protein n=1 Tax=Dactylonectria estremocensis TaxID=1079267 RepID=A0A9P9IIL2_9HYPO|nr:hypothetical protein B0J13DRAFT_566672 [Dactylonectria estremocensis]